jgi:L-arabinose isomerase
VNPNYKHLRVGLAGLGLDTYWAQFDGLRERLVGYLAEVERKLESPERILCNVGLVDSPQKAIDAAHFFRRNDIDILVVYVTTYALSSTVLPLALRTGVPMIFLNLQPAAAIDYESFNRFGNGTEMTGEWLAYCSACPVPEIANVFQRLDLSFHQVTGILHDDPICWNDIEEWLCAAAVAHDLAHARLGLLGHYYNGMLDVATDLTQVAGRFGLHIEILEVDELSSLRREVTEDSIKEKLKEFAEFFDIEDLCPEAELKRAAVTAAALDQFVAANDLDMLAYYYKGTGVPDNESTMSSIILGASMLTGRGIPVAGEYEVKNVIAMKILDLLGVGGSFTEYYAMDYSADCVLMGHDGPGHVAIAQDKIKVRPMKVYHGKVGKGLSVEMSVKHGPVTLLSIVEDKHHGFMLLVAEGESVSGPTLKIGNTNSRYQFPLGARGFVERWNSHGPAHHCAIGTGHVASQIDKLAHLLRLNCIRVC